MALVERPRTLAGIRLGTDAAHAAVERVLMPDAGRVLCAGTGASTLGVRLRRRPGRVVGAVDVERYAPPGFEILRTVRRTQGWARRVLDALVLVGELGRWQSRTWVLRGLREGVRPGGQLVVLMPAVAAVETDPEPGRVRVELARWIDESGWRVTLLEALPDPARRIPPWPDAGRRPVRIDGETRYVTAVELEERCAAAFVVAAVNPTHVAIDRSIVVAASRDLEASRATVEHLVAEVVRDEHAARTEIVFVAGPVSLGDDFDALPPCVRVIRCDRVLDVAEARNRGALAARGELLGFVEPGVALGDGWLARLAAEVVPGVGLAGGIHRDSEGRIVGSAMLCDTRTTPGSVLPRPIEPDDRPWPAEARVDVPAVAGPGLVMARHVFAEAGGFDEALGAYADVDLNLRLRARRMRSVCVPEVELCDIGPPRAASRADRRDRRRFLEKWDGHVDEDLTLPDASPRGAAGGRARPAPLVWTARFFDGGGIADEARSLVLGLDAAGVVVQADPTHWGGYNTPKVRGLPSRLDELVVTHAPERFVHVMHGDLWVEPVPPTALGVPPRPRIRRHPGATWSVGRVMCDTDVVPPNWAAILEPLDELWVPSRVDAERFRVAGLDEERLFIVPECLSPAPYRRLPGPLPVPGVDGFVFLSVCYFDHRKGIDVMLRAYLEEFRADEPVTLAIKLSPALGHTIEEDVLAIGAFVRERLGRDLAAGPRVVVLHRNLSPDEMVRLYRAADAYVLPTRGEGWGRPYMEAMATGLPTIATGWGGQLEFMHDDNSYLVEYELAEMPGQPHLQRAEPSVEHLRFVMRRVFSNRQEAEQRGARARVEILGRYTPERVATLITRRLRERGAPVARRSTRTSVRWHGPQTGVFGMAVANREVCRALRAQGIEVTVDGDALPESSAADAPLVTVRSEWPPSLDAGDDGPVVLMQPWEFGSIPQAWATAVGRSIDEIWVPSRFVRDCYLRSGVDPSRVHVVPQGVDPERFRPDVPPLLLPTERSWRFLFVGGTIPRKGADVVVDTYLSTFGPDDDVCLVVKDLGTDSFYRGQGIGARVRALALEPGHPEILYIEDDLPDEALPGLYTACQCLVHPYRGEGFGLPIAEAMACGLPVIVPRYGPALDFADATTAILLPAVEVWGAAAAVGDVTTVSHPWWTEVDRGALAAAMRDLAENPERARDLGRHASVRVRAGQTWERAATAARQRLGVLTGSPGLSGRRSRPSPNRLSVCMIARDAAALIGASLASVEEVADEIVLIDTGSTDGTPDLARALGARVHRRRWHDDFGAARNAAVDLARGAWILMLDADQTLDPASIEELHRLSHAELLWGFLLRQFNYTGAFGEAMVEHPALRFFPNHPALRYRGRVHEQLIALDPEMPFHVVPCGVVIHHHGYRPQHRDTIAVAERDRPILEAEVAEDPSNAFAGYNLGITYRLLGRLDDAEAEFRRCVALAGPRPGHSYPQYLVSAHLALVDILLGGGRPEEALAHAAAAHRLAPRRADVMYALARSRHVLGDLRGAAQWYQAALATGPGLALAPSDPSAAGWRSWCGLAEVAIDAGRQPEAEALLGRALTGTADPECTAVVARLRARLQTPLVPRAEIV